MQFVLILVVLAALGISESAPCRPVSGATGRLAIAGLGVALVALFAVVISGLAARGLRADFARHRLLLRRFRSLRRVHLVLWLITAGAILYWLDWARLVRFNWHLDRMFLVDEVLILVPVLLPLVLSWAAFYEVDRALSAAVAQRQGPGRWQYLGLHVRHYLGVLLVPLLVLLAVQDTLAILAPEVLHGDLAIVVFLPVLVVLLVLFPVLLRHVWNTRPLPAGPLRTRLERTARRLGISARDILVWHTDGMVANAAVAGLTGRWRYVFLTDGLLSRLSDEEIEAVFAHEAGHVRHRHLLLRVAVMIVPLSLWLFVEQVSPRVSERLDQWLTTGGTGAQVPTGLVLVAALAVYVWVVFGLFSRLLEHQADLFAYRSITSDHHQPEIEILASALEKLARASGMGRNSRGWQHASVARRISFLRQLHRAPKRELRFQRRVRLLGSLVLGFAVSPVVSRILLG